MSKKDITVKKHFKLELPDPQHTIWADQALAPLEDWFPAATYVLDIKQHQQKPDYTARQTQVNPEDCFLDRLALLFSNIKKGGKTPENVTASGLVQDTEAKCWYVYIAKNNGPRDDSGKYSGKRGDDTNFADFLQNWLNMPADEHLHPNPENCYWNRLLEFWRDRIDYYRKKAPTWAQLVDHKDEVSIHFRKDSDFDFDKFKEESDAVAELLPRISEDAWLDFYTFWRRSSRQPYSSPELEPASKDYCHAVHHLEMLGLPRSMWAAFQSFRELRVNRKVEVKIVLLGELSLRRSHMSYVGMAHALKTLANTEDLQISLEETFEHVFAKSKKAENIKSQLQEVEQRCERLKGELAKSKYSEVGLARHISEPDQGSLGVDGAIEVQRHDEKLKSIRLQVQSGSEKLQAEQRLLKTRKAEQLQAGKGPDIYLHCELQILVLFHQLKSAANMKVHSFIGCSKLSCYMCWVVLRNRKYRTRGTHGKVSANWSFQLPLELEGIVKTFQNLRNEWQTLFQRYRNCKFPIWPWFRDTDPSSTEHNKITLSKDDALKTLRETMKLSGYSLREESSPYKIIPEDAHVKPRKGTFATVHLARTNLSTGAMQFIALKQIVMKDKYWLKDVESEINILKDVRHKNILVLKEAFYDSMDPRIVYLATLPWAPDTLHDFFWMVLNNHESSQKWYLPGKLKPWPSILLQCLEGLSYLHERKIKHKDLKPRNILLHQDTTQSSEVLIHPIIADFGLSKHHIQGDRTDNQGTDEFKAPEQFQKDLGSELSSDIWSLGCCFAFIWILLHSGKQGLADLWERIMESEPGKRGFSIRANTEHTLALLREPYTREDDFEMANLMPRMGYLIGKMLIREPMRDRPIAMAAAAVADSFALGRSPYTLKDLNLCLILDTAVAVQPIGRLGAMPVEKLLDNYYDFYQRQAEQLDPGRPKQSKKDIIRNLNIMIFLTPWSENQHCTPATYFDGFNFHEFQLLRMQSIEFIDDSSLTMIKSDELYLQMLAHLEPVQEYISMHVEVGLGIHKPVMELHPRKS